MKRLYEYIYFAHSTIMISIIEDAVADFIEKILFEVEEGIKRFFLVASARASKIKTSDLI